MSKLIWYMGALITVPDDYTSPFENLNDLVALAKANVDQLRFELDTYSGSAGGSVTVKVKAADADGTKIILADGIKFTVLTDAGSIAESMPVEIKNGEAVIHVTRPDAGVSTLSLSDTEGTGLHMTDTATVTFS